MVFITSLAGLEADLLHLIQDYCFDVPVTVEDRQEYLQLLVSEGILEKRIREPRAGNLTNAGHHHF